MNYSFPCLWLQLTGRGFFFITRMFKKYSTQSQENYVCVKQTTLINPKDSNDT